MEITFLGGTRTVTGSIVISINVSTLTVGIRIKMVAVM